MPNMQAIYSERMLPFVEGMLANSEHSNKISRNVEGAAGIGFGKVAVQGTADMGIKAPTSGGVFVGITELDSTQLDTKYPQYNTASVIDKGVVIVRPVVAVTAGQPAYYTATGDITNVASGNTIIPSARFDGSATANNLVKLRLR